MYALNLILQFSNGKRIRLDQSLVLANLIKVVDVKRAWTFFQISLHSTLERVREYIIIY